MHPSKNFVFKNCTFVIVVVVDVGAIVVAHVVPVNIVVVVNIVVLVIVVLEKGIFSCSYNLED